MYDITDMTLMECRNLVDLRQVWQAREDDCHNSTRSIAEAEHRYNNQTRALGRLAAEARHTRLPRIPMSAAVALRRVRRQQQPGIVVSAHALIAYEIFCAAMIDPCPVDRETPLLLLPTLPDGCRPTIAEVVIGYDGMPVPLRILDPRDYMARTSDAAVQDIVARMIAHIGEERIGQRRDIG